MTDGATAAAVAGDMPPPRCTRQYAIAPWLQAPILPDDTRVLAVTADAIGGVALHTEEPVVASRPRQWSFAFVWANGPVPAGATYLGTVEIQQPNPVGDPLPSLVQHVYRLPT